MKVFFDLLTRRWLVAAFLMAAALPATAKEYNLLPVDSFTPLYMHGRASAAKGWMMRDQPREAAFGGADPKYVSGDDCFELEFSGGALTVRFLEPLNDVYRDQIRSIRMEANTIRPLPPAPEYRFTGKTRFNRGVLVIGEKLRLRPSAEWKSFEYKGSSVSEVFAFLPEPGSVFSFKDFRLCAVYPENGITSNSPTAGDSRRSCSSPTTPG